MTLFAGFVIGAFIAYAVTIIFLGTLMKEQAARIRKLQAEKFELHEQLIHTLEGIRHPKYVLRSDGVDVVVERGRPDIETRVAGTVPDGSTVMDLTGIEEDEL